MLGVPLLLCCEGLLPLQPPAWLLVPMPQGQLGHSTGQAAGCWCCALMLGTVWALFFLLSPVSCSWGTARRAGPVPEPEDRAELEGLDRGSAGPMLV